MSLSMGSSKSKQSQQSSSEPWKVAAPFITDFLGKLPGPQGVTDAQKDAFSQLESNVAAGNPYAGQIGATADAAFGTESQSPTASAGYADFQRRMNPIADGTNQDLGNDPYLQQLLSQVGGDAQSRINAQFAAAGRDSSGMNQQAVARGVTQAQLPILVDQLNRERGRSDAAASALYGAGNTTANTVQGLDSAALADRSKGVGLANSALEAQNFGPTQIINLEEQLKSLPLDNASKLAEILFAAGQLGQQTQGTGTEKKSSFGLGLKLI